MGHNASWLRQYLGHCQRLRFSTVSFFLLLLSLIISKVFNVVVPFFFFLASARPCITDEHEAFIRWVLDISFEEQKCKDLITLDTLHAYCGGPKLTPITRRLNEYSHCRKFSLPYFFLFLLCCPCV